MHTIPTSEANPTHYGVQVTGKGAKESALSPAKAIELFSQCICAEELRLMVQ